MERLPCLEYLVNREDDLEAPAMKATLRCKCGGENFRIFHSGKQAHPLLGSWYCSWILPNKKPLVIQAQCVACGVSIPLHCEDRDENGWYIPDTPLMEFAYPKLHDQRLRIEVAYGWEKSSAESEWNPEYSDFCLDAWNDEHPKKIRIYE